MAVLSNPTDLARETLKLLATRRIAPTPENYQRYYHEIAGTQPNRDGAEERVGERLREAAKANPALVPLARLTRLLDEGDLAAFTAQLVTLASGRDGGPRHDWGALLRELLRSLEARQTGSSLARKKDGLERLLIHFGTDPQLFDKLQGLMRSWSEVPEATATVVELDPEAQPAAGTRLALRRRPADSTRQIKELLALTLEMGMAARLERFPPAGRRSPRPGAQRARGPRRRRLEPACRAAAPVLLQDRSARGDRRRAARRAAAVARPAGQQHRRAGGGRQVVERPGGRDPRSHQRAAHHRAHRRSRAPLQGGRLQAEHAQAQPARGASTR